MIFQTPVLLSGAGHFEKLAPCFSASVATLLAAKDDVCSD